MVAADLCLVRVEATSERSKVGREVALDGEVVEEAPIANMSDESEPTQQSGETRGGRSRVAAALESSKTVGFTPQMSQTHGGEFGDRSRGPPWRKSVESDLQRGSTPKAIAVEQTIWALYPTQHV